MIQKNNIKLLKGVENLKVSIISHDEKQVHYKVENTPVCQFDQHSRARIGVKFLNYQVSEQPKYVLYTNLYESLSKNEEFLNETINTLSELEDLRNKAEFKDDYTLMSRNCSYEVIQEYGSLAGQMSRRLKFSEEEFIVGLHWLLRDKLIKLGVEKANKFLPGCDIVKKCEYASADYLSNMFGCLFKGCGRWKSHAEYASFNESCSTREVISKQLEIDIPKSEYELAQVVK